MMSAIRLAAAMMGVTAGASMAAEKLPVLLITGHNNHNWQYTSRVHAETLEATGRFAVTITDDPAATLADAAGLSAYKVFVLDYNDSQSPKRWGAAAEKNFVDAVRGGTGVVSIHAANNAFDGWADYEKMIGLLWREGTGHGKFHEFTVNIVEGEHPIMKGLSDFRIEDELYHKLVNTQKAEYRLLAKAMSTTESGGTGQDEPMAMTLEFGKGRVFHTPLGHVWPGSDGNKMSVLNPGFRALIARGTEWAATGDVTLPAEWKDVRSHNTLSEQEKQDGWTLLFDGTKVDGLRGYKKDAMPTQGWSIVDGTLHHAAGGQGGDLVTVEQYGSFEFSVDWKVAKGGNSGIFYRGNEANQWIWETAFEMQILDDGTHQDGKKPKTRAGCLYDMYPLPVDVARPAGGWNRARVVVKGNDVEHWLNGYKVAAFTIGSEDYKKALANSKFPAMPKYGTLSAGHIGLQDHGDEVWFRNIKVRKLD